jgi:cell division protease FtsH
MSEKVGLVTILADDERPGDPDQFALHTRELVDEESRRIVEEALSDVRALLRQHRRRLDSLSTALLDRETLDEFDAYAAADVSRTRETTV